MSNPMLNESTMQKASTTWAPPQRHGGQFPGLDPQRTTPIDDGPRSEWSSKVMTVNGTITATAALFVLLLASATIGWIRTGAPELVNTVNGPEYNYSIPMLAWAGIVVGFVCVIGLYFKPHLAKFVAPVYAIAQGFFVGAISRMYETYFDGIVVQAAGATIAVFAVMLVLYRTGIIKVTDKFRRTVIAATMGIMLFYGVSFLIRLFAGADSVSFLTSPSLLGIGFSLLVAGIAAMNLALDFDFIERGSKMGLDRNFEWYAAFGLLVTIVWLYLEILRLLSKLRSR